MASSFLTKLLGGLKSFLKNMASPLGGFSVDDAKINVKEGEYSVLYQFGTTAVKDENGEDISNVKGEKIPLNLLMSTSNVKDALAPILKGLNNIGTLKDSNPKEFSNLMFLMLGDDKYDYTKSDEYKQELYEQAKEQAAFEDSASSISDDLQSVMAVESNNEYLTAKYAGKGLLGAKLNNDSALPNVAVSFNGKQWSWEKIAFDYLKYSLECQVPGKDYGAIDNVSLSECAKLIPEYLVKTNTIENAGEVNPDLTTLVKPLLIRIQADIIGYFTDAYNKGIEKKSSAEKEKEEAEQQETADNIEDELFNDNNSNNNNNSGGSDMDAEDYADSIADAFSSKHISVKLRKVQGSTDFELLGLQSNYDPAETLDDLDDIISQDEFILALPEEAQSYNIGVDDDGYDIEPCEECEISCGEGLSHIMQSGIKFYRNLYILHWMARGNDMMKLHELSQTMYEELIEEIDTLGELMVEKCGTVISPSFGCDYLEIRNYEFQEGLDIIVNYIQEYLDMIDYAYPNQTSDVQSVFDEWIRYWNKQMKYFVGRQEE